jgi:site-specific recombinase XerD
MTTEHRVQGFTVVPMDDVPKVRKPRNWPDHTLYATHRDDQIIIVSGRSIEDLSAACDGVQFLPSWRLSMEQGRLSQRTIELYFDAVRTLSMYLAERGLPTEPAETTPEMLREFLRDWGERVGDARVSQLHRTLRVYFAWLLKEGELPGPSPMDRLENVKVSEKAQDEFTDEELTRLVKACAGTDFESRRDLAIIRIFMDNGVRVGGLAGLRFTPDDDDLNDVFVYQHKMRVTLKGGRQFWVPIGREASAALDRYLRARKKHRAAATSPWLWLPIRGRPTATGQVRMTVSGIRQMIHRRATQAGIRANPHKFRYWMASNWDGDIMHLMSIGGWESVEMVRKYHKKGEERKAREAHQKFSPGDRI